MEMMPVFLILSLIPGLYLYGFMRVPFPGCFQKENFFFVFVYNRRKTDLFFETTAAKNKCVPRGCSVTMASADPAGIERESQKN